jgi:hypothetical protein
MFSAMAERERARIIERSLAIKRMAVGETTT